MGLVTKPADYSTATAATHTVFNTLKNTIYDEFNGNVDNANIKSGSEIVPAKIADTAAVLGNATSPGEQTFTRPTKISGRTQFKEADLSGWSFDEDDTQTVDAAPLTTFALTVGKGMYILTSTGAGALTTITGGQEGDVIYLASIDTDVTVTNTDALTVNSIRLRIGTFGVGVAGGMMIRLRYSAVFGTGKWYEV